MRVVLDANVVVSGIFWSGPPQIILKRWIEGKLTLVASGPILAEYVDVLRRMTENQGGELLAWFAVTLGIISIWKRPSAAGPRLSSPGIRTWWS